MQTILIGNNIDQRKFRLGDGHGVTAAKVHHGCLPAIVVRAYGDDLSNGASSLGLIQPALQDVLHIGSRGNPAGGLDPMFSLGPQLPLN
ncbi:MAG: hypothetical protein ACLQSR_07565 [Limisphaerales bacterium]